MARPKGKEKKIPFSSSKEETGSGGEDSVPSQRKRGRPRKVVKDEVEEEELKEVVSLSENVQKEAGKKRKRQKKLGESTENGAEKKADVSRAGVEDPSMPVAAKRDGNRRKGKPRRAAGAFMDGK